MAAVVGISEANVRRIWRALGCKREAPQSRQSPRCFLSSPPPELLNETIDSRLKVVSGTGVLSPGTNGLAEPRRLFTLL
jgi:hypothetical protein